MENTAEIAPTGIIGSGEQNHADMGAASSINIISSLNSSASSSSSSNIDANNSNSYIGDSNALVGNNINISSNSYISSSNSINIGGGGDEDLSNINNNINNNVVLVSSNSDSSYIDPNNISGMVGRMGVMQTGIIDPNNINVNGIVDPNQQMSSNQTYSYSTVVNADGSISNITYDGSGNIVYNTTTSASGSSSNPSTAGTYSYDTSMGASSFQSSGIPIAMPIVSSYGMTSMPYNMNYATQSYGLSTQSNSGVSSSAAGSYASGTIGNSMGGVSGSSYTSMPMSSSMYSHHHYGGASVVNTSVSGVNGGSISTSNPSSYMGQSSAVSYQPMRETGILNLSAESLPDDDSDLNLLTDSQHDERLFDMLHRFWETQTRDMNVLDISTEQDFKNHNDLPLARIKRIMKSDEDVRMISAEAPVLFAKACEMFILELSIRSWGASEKCKRRTLLKEDVDAAIKNTDIFDFLEGLS